MDSKFNHDSITIAGKEIPIQTGFLPVRDLMFYPENPRIYSIICEEDEDPSQEEIFKELSGMEHVKELVQSIKQNGGLREPIIVRNAMVLEGNSRLAAYRILSAKNPVEWGMVKCKILPPDVGDDVAFAILADHISGKKDWKPYEQAGYLYRRHKIHDVPLERIASDMALSQKRIKHLMAVYDFMLRHDEKDPEKWSYYDEYLKSRKVQKIRDANPEMDQIVVDKIRTGDIPTAVDLRDKLKVILSSGKKIVNRFLNCERDFSDCYEAAVSSGNNDGHYKRFHNFRIWLVDSEVQKDILSLDTKIADKCRFELNKIRNSIDHLLKKLPQS